MEKNGYFKEQDMLKWPNFKEFDFSDFERINKMMNYTKIEQRNEFESSKKYTLFEKRPPETNRKYVEYKREDSDDPVKFAVDNLFTLQEGLEIMRNVFFYRAIRNTLQGLFESGILQHILANCKIEYESNKESSEKPSKFHVYERKQEYSTLKLDQLYPGFYIWLGASAVCVIVFFIELLAFRMKTKFETRT